MDSSIQLAVCVLATALLSGCATTHTLSLSEMRAEADRSAPPPPAAPDLASLGSELKRVAFVQLVLDRNPSLEMARQAWKGALARVRRAGALQDPAVEFQLAPLSIASTNARLGFQAMISQQLPWPGKLILEDDAAKYDADAAKSDFEQARRELALAAAVLYDDYFFVARSLEINVQNAALVRDLKADALIQLEAARASIADPIAAEAELAGSPLFHSVNGTAEATTLAARSVGAVLAAQAFHWFDPPRALAEMRRILRAPGVVALVWNERRTGTALLDAYERALFEHGLDYGSVRHQDTASPTMLASFFGTIPFTTLVLPNAQRLDRAGLFGRARSSSYVPQKGHSKHDAMMHALGELFDRHQTDGHVTFDYDTRVYVAAIPL